MAGERGFRVTYLGAEVNRALAEAARRSLNLTPAWKACELVLAEAIDQNFVEEGARGGHATWKALAPATLAARRAGRDTAETAKILQDTGALRTGIRAKGFRNRIEAGPTGPAKAYAHNHDSGTTVPQREFLFVTEKDLDEISATLIDFIAKPFE